MSTYSTVRKGYHFHILTNQLYLNGLTTLQTLVVHYSTISTCQRATTNASRVIYES